MEPNYDPASEVWPEAAKLDRDSGSLSHTIFSLLDASEDRASEVRNAALDALITIAQQHFVATTSILLQYRIKHKAAVGEHARSAVWSCMRHVTTNKSDLKADLGIDVFNDLLTAATEDVNRERGSSESAVTFLLKCFPANNAEVFSSLINPIESYASNVAGPHAPALPAKLFGAMERVFSQNARAVLPYMGRFLSVIVTVMPTAVKTSKDRMLVANTLEVLANVMQENTESFEREINCVSQPGKRVQAENDQQALAVVEATLAADQQQFNRCYTIVLNDWLPAKLVDAELQCTLMSALGALAVVISMEKLTDTAVSLHKISLDLLRRHSENARCCTGAVNCLFYLTLGAPKLLEPHIDTTLELLFELSCRMPDFASPSAIKAHNEIVRGYTVLGRYFTDRAFNLLLNRLENISKVTRQLKQHLTPGEQHPQEVVAVGALTLLSKLLQFNDIQIRPVIPAIEAMLKKTTALNASYPFTKNSVKHALLMLLLTFADTSAVEVTTANFPVEFIVRCCVMPPAGVKHSLEDGSSGNQLSRAGSTMDMRRNDSPPKLTVSRKSEGAKPPIAADSKVDHDQNQFEVADSELCNAARNTLTLMCEAVAATQRLLWPTLFLYLMPAQYSRAVDILAKLLRKLAFLPTSAAGAAADPEKIVTSAIENQTKDRTESVVHDRLAILADYGDSSVPTPPALFARLFILCGSRWRSSDAVADSDSLFYAERARNCLLLMSTLMPVLRPEAQSTWGEACERFVSRKADVSPLLNEKQWQESLLQVLAATLDVDSAQKPSLNEFAVSALSQWPDLLAQSLAQHISTYAAESEQICEFTTERLYLYATLATVLLYIPATDEHASSTVGKCLDLMLGSAHHEDVRERTWLAHVLGTIAQVHMETVLNKLAQYEKSFLSAGGKTGNNQGFLKSLFFSTPSASSATSLGSSSILNDRGSSKSEFEPKSAFVSASPSHLQATVILCYGCVAKLFAPAAADIEDVDTSDLSFPSKLHSQTPRTFSAQSPVESMRQMDKIALHVCQAYLPTTSKQHDSNNFVINYSHRHALCCFATWYAAGRCALLNVAPSSTLSAMIAPPTDLTSPVSTTSPRVAVRNGGASRASGLLSRMSIGSLHSHTQNVAVNAVAPAVPSPEAVVEQFIKTISQFLRHDAVSPVDSSAATIRLCSLPALKELIRLDVHVEKLKRQFSASTFSNVTENEAASPSSSSSSGESLAADKMTEIRPLVELCLHEVLTLTPPVVDGESRTNSAAVVDTSHTSEQSAKLLSKRPSTASVTVSTTTVIIADDTNVSAVDRQKHAMQIHEATVAGLKQFCTTLLHILPTPLVARTLVDLLTPYIESDAEWEQRNALDVLDAVLSRMDHEYPSFAVEPIVGKLFGLLVPRCFDCNADDNAESTGTTKRYAVFCMLKLLKYNTSKTTKTDDNEKTKELTADQLISDWCEILPGYTQVSVREAAKKVAHQVCCILLVRRSQEQLVNMLLSLTSSALLDADRTSSVTGSVYVIDEIFQQIRASELAGVGSEKRNHSLFLQPEHVKQLVVNLGIAHRYTSVAAMAAGSSAAAELGQTSGRPQIPNMVAFNDLLAGCEQCVASLAFISRESLQQCCDTLLSQPLPFDVTVSRFWFAIAEAVSTPTAEKTDAEMMCDMMIEHVMHLIVEDSQYTTPYAAEAEVVSRDHRQYANLSLLQHLCALLEIMRVPLVRQRVLGLQADNSNASCEQFIRIFAALVNIVQALVVAHPARTPLDKFAAPAKANESSSPTADVGSSKKSTLRRFKWLKSPLNSASKVLPRASLESAPPVIANGDMRTHEEWQRVVQVQPITVAVDALKETLRYADFRVSDFNWLMLANVETCDRGLELIVAGVLESLPVAENGRKPQITAANQYYELRLCVEQLAQRCLRSMSSPVEAYRIAGVVMCTAILKIAAQFKQENTRDLAWLVTVVDDVVNNLMVRLRTGGGGGSEDPSAQVRRWCIRGLAALSILSDDVKKIDDTDGLTTKHVNDINYVRCFVTALDDRDDWTSPVVAVEACDALRHVLARTSPANIVEVCNSCATKLKPLLNLDVGVRRHQSSAQTITNNANTSTVKRSSTISLLRMQKFALLAFAALVQRLNNVGHGDDANVPDKSLIANARASLIEHIHAAFISVLIRTVSPSQQRSLQSLESKPKESETANSGISSWPSSVSSDHHDSDDDAVLDADNDVPEAAVQCLHSVLSFLWNATSDVGFDALIPSTAVPLFQPTHAQDKMTNSSPFMKLADSVLAKLLDVAHDTRDTEKLGQLNLSNAANAATMASAAELRAAAALTIGCLLPKASTVLMSATKNSEKGISRSGVTALLVKLLKDPDVMVRRCAAVSIARIFDK